MVGADRSLHVKNVFGRLAATWRDIPGWWRGRRMRARGMHLPLQPWRLAPTVPDNRSIVLAEAKSTPAPLVDVYDLPGRTHAPIPSVMGGHALRMYHLEEAIVLPGYILLDGRSKQVLPLAPIRRTEFEHPLLERSGKDIWLIPRAKRGQSRRFKGPLLIADAPYKGYGHALLEVAPRLLYLDRLPPETRVLTTRKAVSPYSEMFEAMGVSLDRVVTLRGPAYCSEVYVAEGPVDLGNFVSADAWRAFERIAGLAGASSTPTHDRIYVSRAGIERRRLENQEQVEALFRSYGFAIVRPEALPLKDQVRLFANAQMIAGPRGSGMHNIVFSSPQTKLLLLTHRDFVAEIDTLLMRADHALAYVMGDGSTGHPAWVPWTVDLALVERAIKMHFGL